MMIYKNIEDIKRKAESKGEKGNENQRILQRVLKSN